MAWSIDPNVKAWINGAVTICGAIATAGPKIFPSYIPAGEASDIVQTCGLIFFCYGALNTAGNLLSSSKPGALAPPDPPVVLAAQAVASLPPNAGPATIAQVKKVAQEAVVDHQP